MADLAPAPPPNTKPEQSPSPAPGRRVNTASGHVSARATPRVVHQPQSVGDDEGETKSSTLMTEWLTQMPATTPFHKGQVLIVPESPYGQRVAMPRAQTARTVRHGPKCGSWKQHYKEMHAGDKGVGGNKRAVNKGSMSDRGPAIPQSQRYKGENLVYVSPADQRAMKEYGDLQDALQKNQQSILSVRTRRHRYLDKDKMSRGELAQIKHVSLATRRSGPVALSTQSSANFQRTEGDRRRLNTGADMLQREGGTGVRAATAASGSMRESSRGGGSQAMRGGGVKPATSNTISSRAKTADVRTSSSGRSGYGGKGGYGGEIDGEGYGEWSGDGDDAEAYSDDVDFEGGDFGFDGMEKDKGEDKGEEGRNERERGEGKRDGREGDGNDKMQSSPIVSTSQSQQDVKRSPSGDSAIQGIGLAYFKDLDEAPVSRVCVESPHSAAAMARFGVVEEDLLPRSVEYFLSRGDDERRAKMKADFAEKTRLRLLSTLEEERQRHINAYAVLIPETDTVGTEPTVELRALGSTARSSYVERGKVGAIYKKSSNTAMDNRTLVSEKCRLQLQKLESREKQRMASILRTSIQSKDRIDELEGKMRETQAKKMELLQGMQEKVRVERQRKEEAHKRLTEAQMAELQNGIRVREEIHREKHAKAQKTVESVNESTRERMQDQSLLGELRRDRYKTKLAMRERAQEHMRLQMQEKNARSEKVLEFQNKERGRHVIDTMKKVRELAQERERIIDMVGVYQETGKFPVKGVQALKTDVVHGFLAVGEKEIPEYTEDENPDALLVEIDSAVMGQVGKGKCDFFKIYLPVGTQKVTVAVHKISGETDFCIGNGEQPFPTASDCTWKRGPDSDRITLHSFDRGYTTGFIYVGVVGRSTGACEFTLSVKVHSTAGDGGGGGWRGSRNTSAMSGRSSANISVVSRQNSHVGEGGGGGALKKPRPPAREGDGEKGGGVGGKEETMTRVAAGRETWLSWEAEQRRKRGLIGEEGEGGEGRGDDKEGDVEGDGGETGEEVLDVIEKANLAGKVGEAPLEEIAEESHQEGKFEDAPLEEIAEESHKEEKVEESHQEGKAVDGDGDADTGAGAAADGGQVGLSSGGEILEGGEGGVVVGGGIDEGGNGVDHHGAEEEKIGAEGQVGMPENGMVDDGNIAIHHAELDTLGATQPEATQQPLTKTEATQQPVAAPVPAPVSAPVGHVTTPVPTPLANKLPHSKTLSELEAMAWEDVAKWMLDLDVSDEVVKLVQSEKVPGVQVASMTVEELVGDLGMSKLQAKRLVLNRIP